MASSNSNYGPKPFSWGRTIAIAFAVALHAFAFIVLIAPAGPPQAPQVKKDQIVQVSFIEPPPPPPPPP
ncbi:hypothetical protein UU5_08493, partial [Rhodanobacter sp. 115]